MWGLGIRIYFAWFYGWQRHGKILLYGRTKIHASSLTLKSAGILVLFVWDALLIGLGIERYTTNAKECSMFTTSKGLSDFV